MPEIVRFYGIIIKMFLNPKKTNLHIFTPFTMNIKDVG